MAKAMSKSKKPEQDSGNGKYIKWFWLLFGSGIVLLFLVFLLTSWGVFGRLPDETVLENPETNLATEIVDSQGETLGKFYKENRTPVKFDSLPDHLVNALIAVEDERYYDHSGIDGKGTVRAFAFLGSRGGASTLSQQLAKQLFTDQVSSSKIERAFQKVKEWVIAVRLERQYTKEEIITMYFNKYDFLNQAIGIRSASRIYFSKEPMELNTAESAMLAGMFKNSSLYNPLRRPELVKERRNVVLAQMAKNDYITQEVKDSLQGLPLDLRHSPEGHDEGVATYFRAYLQEFLQDWIKSNPKSDGTLFNIYRDGLKIYTSIDTEMQKHAEDAVKEHMAHIQKEFNRQNEKNKTAPFRDIEEDDVEKIIENAMKVSDRWKKMVAQGKSENEIRASFKKKADMRIFTWNGDRDTTMTPRDSIIYYKSILRAGMMSMRPQTGEVKAWVGGINFKHFKYDAVKRQKRQVGSTFKPFLYATAMDQLHLSPCETLPNTQHTIEAGKHGNTKDWTPKNSSANYGGMLTLKDALAQSINTISARLIDKVGPRPVIDLIDKLGVDTADIPAVPSLALGTVDLSIFEMVSAYSAFVNEGVYVKPVIVTRIEDKNGTVLYQHVPETKDVLSKEAAYVTVNLMEGVTRSGSGQRLRGTGATARKDFQNAVTGYPYDFKNPIAGKTGTTQNNSDGWFMGMVPDLVTGVWVGGEDRSVHFPTTRYGQGATMALPIWGLYMKDLYADEDIEVSDGRFSKPDNVSVELDCEAYQQDEEENGEEDVPEELDF